MKCHPVMEASMFLSSAMGVTNAQLERLKELRFPVNLLSGTDSTIFLDNKATLVCRFT